MTTTWSEIYDLIENAKGELLASELRKNFDDDQDFLFQVWTTYKDEEIYGASPSLKYAFVLWCKYQAEDILEGTLDRVLQRILDNTDGRNHLVIANVEDFAESCWSQWKEKKKAVAET